MSADGCILIVTTPSRISLIPVADLESGWVVIRATDPLTTIVVHPTDHFIAVGSVKGKIHFYYCLDPIWWAERAKAQREKGEKNAVPAPSPSVTLHWHAHAVGALQFTANGAYLLSGGEEAVLVNWQLRSTGQKDFLPRLGAPIIGMTLSPKSAERDQEIAITLRDGTILFVANQNMSIKRSIAGIKWGKSDSFPYFCCILKALQMPLLWKHITREIRNCRSPYSLVLAILSYLHLTLPPSNSLPNLLELTYSSLKFRHPTELQIAKVMLYRLSQSVLSELHFLPPVNGWQRTRAGNRKNSHSNLYSNSGIEELTL